MSFKSRYISSDSSSNLPNYSPSKRRLPSPPGGGDMSRSNRRGRHVTIVDPLEIDSKVNLLAQSLEDTNYNIDGINTKLSDYRNLHDDSMDALSKLQQNLEGSIHELRKSRKQKSSMKDSKSMRSRRSSSLSLRGVEPSCRDLDLSSEDDSDYPGTMKRSSSLYGILSKRSSRNNLHRSTENRSQRFRNDDDDGGEDDFDSGRYRPRSRAQSNRRRSRSRGDYESAADRVEKRLKEIDREMTRERDAASQYASDVANDVLLRSQPKRQVDDSDTSRNRLVHLESSKREVESELETTRRKLEKSEGGKEALMSQIAELRNLIMKSDKEKESLLQKVEERDLNKLQSEKQVSNHAKSAAAEQMERNQKRQQEEIDELRLALRKSSGISQVEELKRNLEKSERQRHQLSDHIEVLTQDLEKKEQANTRLLNQHHDLQSDLTSTEQDKEKLLSKLEEAFSKLKDHARESDSLSKDLRIKGQESLRLEKENDEIRNMAQDTVKQWKNKCRKLEKELERAQDNIESLASKNEEMVKNQISKNNQAKYVMQENEQLRLEAEELKSKCTDQEVKLQRRNTQMEQTEVERQVLIDQISNLKQICSDKSQQIEVLTQKVERISGKLMITEEDLVRTQEREETTKQLNVELQADLTKLKSQRSDLEKEIETLRTDRSNLVKRNDTKVTEIEKELDELNNKFQMEREAGNNEVKTLHDQLHEKDQEKAEVVKLMSKHHEEERKFLESEIQRFNGEATQARSSCRELHRQLDEARESLSQMKDEHFTSRKDLESFRDDYQTTKESLDYKCVELAQVADRLLRTEEELISCQRKSKKAEKQLQDIRDIFVIELGEMEMMLGITCNHLQLQDQDPSSSSWLSSVQKKMSLIKQSLEKKINRYRSEISDAKLQRNQSKKLYKSLESENRKLMLEITDQNKVVDELSREKTSLLIENKEARFVVQDLEDRVTNLTQDLQLHEDDEPHQISTSTCCSPLLTRNCSSSFARKYFSRIEKESLKEREKISQRYKRYKETMESIQADLNRSGGKRSFCSPTRLESSSGGCISPIRRVTMTDQSPIVHDYHSSLPTSSSPKHRNDVK